MDENGGAPSHRRTANGRFVNSRPSQRGQAVASALSSDRFDWNPDIYGIRAFESCRARHCKLFGQRQRQSVRVGRLRQPDTYDLGPEASRSLFLSRSGHSGLTRRARRKECASPVQAGTMFALWRKRLSGSQVRLILRSLANRSGPKAAATRAAV